MTAQHVFQFETAKGLDKTRLGGKGAGLVEMTALGLPVPPGFIISTEACQLFRKAGRRLSNSLWDEIVGGMQKLEHQVGRGFGDPNSPLIVSARSGAPVSMPGMMDSFLNLGMVNSTLPGLRAIYGNDLFVDDAFNRLVKAFSSRTTLTSSEIREHITKDPLAQLRVAVESIFASWTSERATEYRNYHGLSHDMGTAVVIQQQVFGNLNDLSGTGVAFTRDPNKGMPGLYGEFIWRAQGEELVSGSRTPDPITTLAERLPQAFDELTEIGRTLERHYRFVPEIEFTVENAKLWVLQVRSGKLSKRASVKVTVDFVGEGHLSIQEALGRIPEREVNSITDAKFTEAGVQDALRSQRLVTTGLAASPGVAVGRVVFDAQRAEQLGSQGEHVILVRPMASPDDVVGMFRSQGLVTVLGGTTSHAALVARSLNRPCVVGCEEIEINETKQTFSVNGRTVRADDFISVDAVSGAIYEGKIEVETLKTYPELEVLRDWHKRHYSSLWTLACYPPDNEERRLDLRRSAEATLFDSQWVTEKARVADLLRVFGDEERIVQRVVHAEDVYSLRKWMLDAHSKGCWNGPRTCYDRGRIGEAPWQMAIKTEQEIEDFLSDPGYVGRGRYGGYQRWISDPLLREGLREIIVMYDPPQKGLPKYESEHFVFTVTPQVDPVRIVVELNLYTSQLRSLENAEASHLIHIEMPIESDDRFRRGQRRFSFGRSHFNDYHVAVVARRLRRIQMEKANGRFSPAKAADAVRRSLGPRLSTRQAIVDRVLALGDRALSQEINEDSAGNLITHAMRQSTFLPSMLERIVKPTPLEVAKEVDKLVFEKWWGPPLELPYAMKVLDEVARMNTLEAQGRVDADGRVQYIKIYDTKGRDEAKRVEALLRSLPNDADL